MGLPLENQADYRALVRKQLSTPAGDSAVAAQILREMADCMRDVIVARRTDPKDDLISRLWSAEIDGAPVAQEDMENFAVLLFTAGLDTVMNAMGFGVRHLATDQALQDRLRADPGLIVDAAEEMLRRYTFLFGTRRVAKDLSFHGVEMRRNDRLVLGLPTANLDEERWPVPEVVDVDRDDKAHITFNGGPHRCVGSHLARIEIQILYERMLAILPPFRLDADRVATFHGGPVIGPDMLDLVWDLT
jgi:cytochrome P450